MTGKRAGQQFGSETKAADGCIVTFRLADGAIQVEHFTQQTTSKGTLHTRVRTKIGASYLEQAVARADELGARIVTISTPTTILRDLGGTRAQQREGMRSDELQLPELRMLGQIGRTDLLVESTDRRDWASTSIQHVTAHKSAHAGPRGQ
jgi:hypothetical protein